VGGYEATEADAGWTKGAIVEHFDLVVVGAGPAGIATAIEFHRLRPEKRILLVEAGRAHRRRPCPVDHGRRCIGCGGICNVISGFGGSMHYGDGIKLSLLPSGRRLFDLFGEEQAEQLCMDAFSLLTASIPHSLKFAGGEISSNTLNCFRELGLEIRQYPVAVLAESLLETVIDDLFDKITKASVVLTETSVTQIVSKSGELELTLSSRSSVSRVRSSKVVLATGRRGFDEKREMLAALEVDFRSPNPSVGVRFEMPAQLLGPIGAEHPDLKITQHVGETKQKVKTFCFCGGANGGRIKFTRYFHGFGQDIITIDGHETVERSLGKRALAGNFGLLCQLTKERSVASFVDVYVRELGGRPGAQSYDDFFGRQVTSASSWHALNNGLPFEPSVKDLHMSRLDVLFTDDQLQALKESFERVMRPILVQQQEDLSAMQHRILVVGPEIEFFWDEVQVSRTCETSQRGLYVVGDQAGIAQGAVQGAMMGMAAARSAALADVSAA
jgi:uncharacterized FAD-dependent dehydrogenase